MLLLSGTQSTDSVLVDDGESLSVFLEMKPSQMPSIGMGECRPMDATVNVVHHGSLDAEQLST